VSLLRRSLFKHVGRGVPVARLLLVGEVAVMAGRHISRLDAVERRRLASLLGAAARHPTSLGAAEREELTGLVARMEPRLFLGSAVRRVSPVPLPPRLLYGKRKSRARQAARARRRS